MIDVLYSTWLPWSDMTMIVFTFFPPFFFVFFLKKITWIICLWRKNIASIIWLVAINISTEFILKFHFFKFFNVIDCMKPLNWAHWELNILPHFLWLEVLSFFIVKLILSSHEDDCQISVELISCSTWLISAQIVWSVHHLCVHCTVYWLKKKYVEIH